MLRHHFLKGFLRLVCVGFCRQIVGMMQGSDDELFLHSDGKYGVTLF